MLPIKKACNGDLEKIKSCIKLRQLNEGYVNSTDIEDFIDQPKVINGASDIIAKILDRKWRAHKSCCKCK